MERRTIWQLQEAKAKLSQLVQRAMEEGPQTVTRHDRDTVVVLSVAEYERLRRSKSSPLEVLMPCPEAELDLQREQAHPYEPKH